MKFLIFVILGSGNFFNGINGLDFIRRELNCTQRNPLKLKVDLPLKTQVGFLITGFLVGSSLVLSGSEKAREKVWFGWELITSPNHAQMENKVAFHIKSFNDELKQNDQLDKGVHFMTGYVFSKIVAIPCAYLIHTIEGNSSRTIPDKAYTLASLLVFAGGVFEEWIDGYEKAEGFSYTDLVMNSLGIFTSYLKRKGKLDFIDFYWSFSMPPPSWKYYWWDYMAGYSFNIRINFHPPSQLIKWWSSYTAYLPDKNFFSKLKITQHFP